MKVYESRQYYDPRQGTQVIRSVPSIPVNVKSIGALFILIIASNLVTYSLSSVASFFSNSAAAAKTENLYLLNKAGIFVADVESFESKVKEVAKDLDVPPEWLMAVMYAESKFDASVSNHRGSGAVGLIQWMPPTAKELGTTIAKLKNLNHVEQLQYVYLYFKNVKNRYGDFDSLTEFYLAVLYPKAQNQDACYTLYASPAKAYKQNIGLDEDKDGRVVVSDIDKRMQRLYPTAYIAQHKDVQ